MRHIQIFLQQILDKGCLPDLLKSGHVLEHRNQSCNHDPHVNIGVPFTENLKFIVLLVNFYKKYDSKGTISSVPFCQVIDIFLALWRIDLMYFEIEDNYWQLPLT